MGKVMTKVKLTNQDDEALVRRGLLPADQVRTVEVEALVDTGATMLVLPADVCRKLGLTPVERRRVRYADGRVREVPRVKNVGIEILGRDMVGSALVEAEGTTPLIGQIPLEELDLVVHPGTGDLMPDPDSPDAPLLDLLRAS
ncbi:MAG: clan AA aspartic protease [Myxococcales bacterium]|nr:clan AA aspartic protease [Myxococcales bacterium]